MHEEIILFDGLGVVADELVPPGTIAIMVHGGEVRIVAVEDLRAMVEEIGSGRIEGLSMAPSEFSLVQAVMERRKSEGESGQDA